MTTINLQGVADTIRDSVATQRKIYLNSISRVIAKLLLNSYHGSNIESAFLIYEIISIEDRLFVMLTACKAAYGIPHSPIFQTQEYEVVYYNPYTDSINIKPLGLEVTSVPPQGLVSIPYHMTIGRVYSPIHMVAPQLKPVPKQIDRKLDLQSISYAEWTGFTPFKLSDCCKKSKVWVTGFNHLTCAKCGKRVYI